MTQHFQNSLLFAILFYSQTGFSFSSRDVIRCELGEGGIGLEEVAPGRFFYSHSEGFAGEGPSGEAILSFEKTAEGCRLKVSGKEGKVLNEFAWRFKDGVQPSPQAKRPADAKCVLKKRYSLSVAKCLPPTETEPGNQCHGEGGIDLTVVTPLGSGSPRPKLIAFSGGAAIEASVSSSGSMMGEGVAVWRDPKDKNGWCYGSETLFPYRCRSLKTRVEVKNKKGEVVGILEPSSKYAVFKPAKMPFQSLGYTLDERLGQIRVEENGDQTQVTVLKVTSANALSQELGTLTIKGETTLPTRFRSYNRPRPQFGNGQKWTADCNGLLPERSSSAPDPNAGTT